MHDSPYSSPEITELGAAAEITEDGTSPVAEVPGTGVYYDASKGQREDDSGDESESESESEST